MPASSVYPLARVVVRMLTRACAGLASGSYIFDAWAKVDSSMHRPSPLSLILLALTGCLTEGPAPRGHQLFHSQTLESPGFVKVGTDWNVRFSERLAVANGVRGGVYDLWTSSFDGDVQRRVVTNWSDHWGGPGWDPVDGHGGHYFWANEREVPSGGGTAVVGSWIRLGPTFEEQHRIEGASTAMPFTAPLSWIYDDPSRAHCPGFPDLRDGCPQALFERPASSGQTSPTLYLWDGQFEIPIGIDNGGFQNQITGDGSIYCILGGKRTFSRVLRPSNKVESLRDNVSSFQLRGDQRYVALGVSDNNTSKTIIRNLTTGAEVTLTRPNASPLIGFDGGDGFSYWQGATSSAPAERHTMHINTGADTFVTLPAPLTNQVSVMDRPGSDESLRIDSLGHGVFTGRNDYVAKRVINGPLIMPSFTGDGKYLIHLLRAASTLYDPDIQGALMFQDANLVEPDVMVSLPGLLLTVRRGAPYFFLNQDNCATIGCTLAFWAHLGRASSDLYFADYRPGTLPTNVRLMAQSIMSVSVSEHNLFGIVNVSQQDGVGDLVYRDLDTNTDTRYSQGVSDASQHTDEGGSELWHSWAAYIIRGRAESDRSGLWITRLASPPADGGTD
jgi:hypothetical protein